MTAQRRIVALAVIAVAALPTAAHGQLAVTSNDNKVVLDNGTVKVLPNPSPDTVTILDLQTLPPRVVAEIAAPGSVVGPPVSAHTGRESGARRVVHEDRPERSDEDGAGH